MPEQLADQMDPAESSDAHHFLSHIDRIKALISLSPCGREGISHHVFRQTLGPTISRSQLLGELDVLKRDVAYAGHSSINADSSTDASERVQLASHRDEIQSFRTELSRVKAECEEWLEDAERRLDRAIEDKEHAESRAESLSAAINAKQDEYAALGSSSQAELAALQSRNKVLNDKLRALEVSVDELRRQADSATVDLNKSRDQLRTIESDLRESTEARQAALDQLQAVMADSATKEVAAKERLAGLAGQLAKATSSLKTEVEAKNSATKNVLSLESRVQEIDANLHRTEAELQNSQSELAKVQLSSHEAGKSHQEKLDKLRASHKTALDQSQDKIHRFESEATRLQQLATESSEECTAARSATETLKKSHKAELDRHNASMSNVKSELKKELDMHKQTIDARDVAEKEVERLKKSHKVSIDGMQREIDSVKSELNRAETARDKALQECDAIKASLDELQKTHKESADRLTSEKIKAESQLQTEKVENALLAKKTAETNDEKAQQLKIQHEATVSELKTRLSQVQKDQESAAKAQRQEVQARIDALTASHEAALRTRQQSHETDLKKAEHERTVAAQQAKDGHDQQVMALRVEHDKVVEKLNTDRDGLETRLQHAHDSKLDALKKQHDASIADMQAKHDKALKAEASKTIEANAAHLKALEARERSLNDEHVANKEASDQNHKAEVKSIEARHHDAVEAQRLLLEQVKARSEEEVAALRSANVTATEALTKTHAGECQALQQRLAEAVTKAEESEARHLRELDQAREKEVRTAQELEKGILAIKKLDAEINSLGDDHTAQLEQALSRQQKKFDDARVERDDGHAKAIKTIESSLDSERARAQTELANEKADKQAQIVKVQQTHAQELNTANRASSMQIAETIRSMTERYDQQKVASAEQLRELQSKHEAELEQLRSTFHSDKASLTEAKAQAESRLDITLAEHKALARDSKDLSAQIQALHLRGTDRESERLDMETNFRTQLEQASAKLDEAQSKVAALEEQLERVDQEPVLDPARFSYMSDELDNSPFDRRSSVTSSTSAYSIRDGARIPFSSLSQNTPSSIARSSRRLTDASEETPRRNLYSSQRWSHHDDGMSITSQDPGADSVEGTATVDGQGVENNSGGPDKPLTRRQSLIRSMKRLKSKQGSRQSGDSRDGHSRQGSGSVDHSGRS